MAAQDGHDLVQLTVAKTTANTALRWIPPFLPTLAAAFATSTTTLTTILGVAELAGLTTLFAGRRLDQGSERVVMTVGLVTVSAACALATAGVVPVFAIAALLLVAGNANFTVAGHAWISHRVPYYRRARSIGLFETSWALSLLVGAPIIAVLIDRWGWRAPFVALAAATLLAALAIRPRHRVPRPAAGLLVVSGPTARLDRQAAQVIAGVALLAAAGLSVFVVSGTWLRDSFDVSTAGLGTVAMAFGAVELVASGGSAALADRTGKRASVLAGIFVLLFGLAAMASAGSSVVVGVLGLVLLLLGFEFAFVTSLSLLSEAMPDARGSTLAIGTAASTAARAAGMVLSGVLYGAWGIGGTIALSGVCAVSAGGLFVGVKRS
ncbi:MAG: MFS transporter [Acidimicrobiia bacterium]|nr:MFS transporter [Acidimicrobiia bacterium]